MESFNDQSYLQVHLWRSTFRKMTYPLFLCATFYMSNKDNNIETLNEAIIAQEKIANEEWFDEDDAEEESSDDEEEEDEDGDDEDDKDKELFYFYDCIGCKAIFREERELLQHIVICDLI